MKDKIVRILLSNNLKCYEELKALFIIGPIPIRKDRKFLRKFRTSKIKFNLNKKRSL